MLLTFMGSRPWRTLNSGLKWLARILSFGATHLCVWIGPQDHLSLALWLFSAAGEAGIRGLLKGLHPAP